MTNLGFVGFDAFYYDVYHYSRSQFKMQLTSPSPLFLKTVWNGDNEYYGQDRAELLLGCWSVPSSMLVITSYRMYSEHKTWKMICVCVFVSRTFMQSPHFFGGQNVFFEVVFHHFALIVTLVKQLSEGVKVFSLQPSGSSTMPAWRLMSS